MMDSMTGNILLEARENVRIPHECKNAIRTLKRKIDLWTFLKSYVKLTLGPLKCEIVNVRADVNPKHYFKESTKNQKKRINHNNF